MDNTREQLIAAARTLSKDSRGTRTSTTQSAISKQLDVEELEMLLEAYFVQIDGTLNKLSTVCNSTDAFVRLYIFWLEKRREGKQY